MFNIGFDPLVSVYLPTYNRLALLKRAVESVLCQTYKNIELIVVDDGSDDGTQEYLEDLSKNDGRVRVFYKSQFDKKKGAPASRNIAIINANGRYVTGLDDDDYFHKDRIRVLMGHVNEGYSCVASNWYRIHGENFSRNSYLKRVVSYKDLFYGNFLGTQVLVERSKLMEAGLFDEELRASQDLDMWIRLTKLHGDALRLRSPLYYMDVSHQEKRISASDARAVGTYQFINKYKGEMSHGQIVYKQDSMGDKPKSRFEKVLSIKDYGLKIVVNIVRSKLKII
ncbi:glycosyltransferase [Halomonas sp. 328]|uniref:glycosyltransferase n=1 Tax=Halomonas sp. 328 TaxID=2776704 RepID=UPI0018A7377B|nr:glycosyltransferase [Halomonas sp. 328]MBF8224472.1 glycosyltransferase [Halomonas sp. 328]